MYECRNDTIPRRTPLNGFGSGDLRDTTRAQVYAVWEGHGAEVPEMWWL